MRGLLPAWWCALVELMLAVTACYSCLAEPLTCGLREGVARNRFLGLSRVSEGHRRSCPSESD